MSIEVMFGELKTAEQSLVAIADLALAPGASILVMRMVKKVSVELATLEELRVKLVKELGEEKEGNFAVQAEKLPEFQERYGKELQAKITLDCEPLTQATFGAAPVKAKDLLLLGPLFKGD